MFHMPRLYSVAFRVILVLPPPLPPVELLLLGLKLSKHQPLEEKLICSVQLLLLRSFRDPLHLHV